MNSLAIDIGRSAIKIAVNSVSTIFPTAVCPAVDLTMSEAAEAAKQDTVEIDGRRYFIGKTAVVQSRTPASEGLRDDWIESDEHRALLKGAYQKARRESGVDEVMLILGLPSRLHGAQKARLAEIASITLGLPLEQIRVVPQPFGAYSALILDENANYASKRDPESESWGVIDVGYYTTDFALMHEGQWTAFAAESVGGTHKAAEYLREKVTHLDLHEAESTLLRKSVKHHGKTIDLVREVDEVAERLANEIIGSASQVLGSRLPRLDGILIAGGGSELVFSAIKKKWDHSHSIPNPRFAVAEGMRRYGVGLLRSIKGE